MDVAQRIAGAREVLTKTERRVAEVVLRRPEVVAFGTVAELAEAAGSGAATVVRLAGKLGFEGFTGLQAAVQAELEGRLRPAVERIRELAAADVVDLVSVAAARESTNVEQTLGAVRRDDFAEACELLARRARRVLVVSGEATRGVALQFVAMLAALRADVELLDGNPVSLAARLAMVEPTDAAVAVDLRRYEAWVLDAARTVAEQGATVVAITDSRLSPLASLGTVSFVVAAEGAGPFDSHVGTLALLNAVVAGIAERLSGDATRRLDAIEQLWSANGLLLER